MNPYCEALNIWIILKSKLQMLHDKDIEQMGKGIVLTVSICTLKRSR